MGFLGKIMKGIGNAVSGIAKGIVKFAKSPLGQLAINIGLSLVTGGVGGLLSKGLGMLGGGGLGGLLSGGGLGQVFSGFASKFLGSAGSLLSGGGLSSVWNFAKQAMGSGDLLSMVKSLATARQNGPQADATTNQMVDQNLLQLMAYRHAQLLQAQAA